LYCIANKTKTKIAESRLKTSKVVKKGGKKLTQNLKKAGKSRQGEGVKKIEKSVAVVYGQPLISETQTKIEKKNCLPWSKKLG
jgi:hypothetical protein